MWPLTTYPRAARPGICQGNYSPGRFETMKDFTRSGEPLAGERLAGTHRSRTLLAAVAQFERVRHRRADQGARAHMRRQGRHLGGCAHRGWLGCAAVVCWGRAWKGVQRHGDGS
jgi:hypothetical protein